MVESIDDPSPAILDFVAMFAAKIRSVAWNPASKMSPSMLSFGFSLCPSFQRKLTAIRNIFEGQRKTGILFDLSACTTGRDLSCDPRWASRQRRKPKLDEILRVAPIPTFSPNAVGGEGAEDSSVAALEPSPPSLLGGEGRERGRRRGLRCSCRNIHSPALRTSIPNSSERKLE
ncbi:hypothetical protein [Tahibacter soli]|uniref:Uncharacterized protein n=1 Tax=Tahibacter soli TaxID=2983605 RepID=A0A9X4BJW4_9GAMM|nr:hypothetical protein [Tahibacter soli]MDC8015521.1 hypothetical protein [Tahibacter soli]